MIDLPQPTGAELWPPEEPGPEARLHKPWRALIAVAEVLLAVVAVWGAFALWRVGIVTVVTTADDGAVLESRRVFSGFLAGAIGLGTLAAILLVDSVRQVMLALRARHPAPKD